MSHQSQAFANSVLLPLLLLKCNLVLRISIPLQPEPHGNKRRCNPSLGQRECSIPWQLFFINEAYRSWSSNRRETMTEQNIEVRVRDLVWYTIETRACFKYTPIHSQSYSIADSWRLLPGYCSLSFSCGALVRVQVTLPEQSPSRDLCEYPDQNFSLLCTSARDRVGQTSRDRSFSAVSIHWL